MKIRDGFVSNSSSSSFAILRSHMSIKQYNYLRNHIHYANLKQWDDYGNTQHSEGDQWSVKLLNDRVSCATNMDNFDLHKFVIEVLEIPEEAIVDYYHS